MSPVSDHVRTIDPELASEAFSTAQAIAAEYSVVTHPELVARAPELAASLPPALLAACVPPDPHRGLFVLHGFAVDDEALGPTPARWAASDPLQANAWDVLVLLMASAMGTVFGWHGQQDGRLVHDIVPARGAEREQTGASSSVLLSPHTEDAFHPARADFLMLGCLRNRERIGTTAACVREIDLSDEDFGTLSRPTVPILPDDSYGEFQVAAGPPPPVRTLWRNDDGVCLRYDPAYTPLAEAGSAYRAAYARLGAELERVSTTVALDPGEFLVLDNDAIVHGRVPFTARYDGTDRWLKRVNIRARAGRRPADEAAEHGYGQEVVDPYA
jgi:L-asparagine oxygenase